MIRRETLAGIKAMVLLRFTAVILMPLASGCSAWRDDTTPTRCRIVNGPREQQDRNGRFMRQCKIFSGVRV